MEYNNGIQGLQFEYSDDEQEGDAKLDLTKTLPPNFVFSADMNKVPGHQHSFSSCGVPTDDIRNHPIAESNLYRLTMGLGRSDPSLLAQSTENVSVPEEHHQYHSRKSPTRALSFNHRKRSAIAGSPSIQRLSLANPIGSSWSSPRNSPGLGHQFGDSRYCMRPEYDRGRRFSINSVTSGYHTENTGSPSDTISSFGSYGDLHQLPFKPNESDAGLIAFTNQLSDYNKRGGRRRHRSLSPPGRSPRGSFGPYDIQVKHFQEKFKKAKIVMEDKLSKYLEDHSDTKLKLSDGTLSFLKSQVMRYASDLLTASKNETLYSAFFVELSSGVEKILQKIYECEQGRERGAMLKLVKNLLAILSQPARLLECMEISPDYLMSDPEALKFSLQSPSHVPFILSKLKKTMESHEALEKAKRKSAVIEPRMNNVTLNDFEPMKLISQGAYSSVHLVRHKQTRERFAMKKVNKQRMLMRKQVEQVFHERDILSFADNPFVVGFLCTFQTKHHLYYVMEFVEGGDIASLIKNVGALPVELARLYVAETHLGVEFIHSLGVIHRDLKPDNLLITSEGHIKLTDFGLSKVGLTISTSMVDDINRDRQFKDSKVLGTPDYIAPEVILGQPYGFPVDYWSMGVILYEMLIGVTPFGSTTVEDLFDEITDENIGIKWPEDQDEDDPIPKEAQSLVEGLLIHNPDFRLGCQSRGGVLGVKQHKFFESIDWDNLLRVKSEFVPELQGEEDTSYFDTRSDRYKHDHSSDDEIYDDEESHRAFIKFDSQGRRMSILLSDLSLNSSFEEENKRRTSEVSNITSFSEGSGKNDDMEHEELVTEIDDVSPDEDSRTFPVSSRRTMSIRSTTSTEGDSIPDDAIVVPRHGRSNSEIPLTQSTNKADTERNRRSRSIGDNPPIFEKDPMPHPTKKISSDALSPRNSVMMSSPISIHRNEKGFGFNFKVIRVYMGETDNYRLHHVVDRVEMGGPAEDAGLKCGHVITHVNGEKITGLTHTEVLRMILGEKANTVMLHTISMEETSIRKGGRSRSSFGHRIARKFNPFKNKSPSSSSLKKRSITIKRTSRRKDVPPRPNSPDSSSTSNSPREPKRRDSFKDKILRFGRGKHNPVSPLVQTPSPSGMQLNITSRSSSTSPMTYATSPLSSPTGSTQQLPMEGMQMESPPESPTSSKNSRKPGRSSSLCTKLEQVEVPSGSHANLKERHSFYGQTLTPNPPPSSLIRKTSNSELAACSKLSMSPLLKQTKSPETRKKGPPSPRMERSSKMSTSMTMVEKHKLYENL